MNVRVIGLWHMGTVVSACLASVGHDVVGLDHDAVLIGRLLEGRPPVYEPGLDTLLREGLSTGRLAFTSNENDVLDASEVVWITFDTPLDEDDHADVEYVEDRVKRLFPQIPNGGLVLISSQVPVGTTRHLEELYQSEYPANRVSFAYAPENLRLGNAIASFKQPDRVVIGLRTQDDRGRITSLFRPFADRIEWMSVESAEMTKHALNAFLAASVSFINELAVLCEQVGADAKEVERGLKSEHRIGPEAYLSPGAAFAGGTLARDVDFLIQLGSRYGKPMHLISGIRTSNDEHKKWIRNKLQQILGALEDQCIALWGLTYKPGTDTLRRSSAIELCAWLSRKGATVQAYDPGVKSLPSELSQLIGLHPSAEDALSGASCLVVGTAWPEFSSIGAETVSSKMRAPNVVDPFRILETSLGADPRIHYFTVGKPGS